jgi:hypothetical protein
MAIVTHSPTAADYRRLAETRDRWHAALTGLTVTALVILVFWLLPLPARATGQACERSIEPGDTKCVMPRFRHGVQYADPPVSDGEIGWDARTQPPVTFS